MGKRWRKLSAITKAKRDIARATGIPTTESGRRRKFGQLPGGCAVVVIAFGLPIAGALGYWLVS